MVSPSRLLLYMSTLWLILFGMGFFSINVEYNFYPTFLLLGITALFVIGSIIARAFARSRPTKNEGAITLQLALWRNSVRVRTIFRFTVAVSAVGCALRFYDRFVVRGLLDSSSFADARLTLIDLGQSSGTLSILAALMFSFSYGTFFLTRALWPSLSVSARLLGVFVSLYPIFEGFGQGGITASVSCVLYYAFVHRALSEKGNSTWTIIKKNKTKIIFYSVIASLVALFSSAIFLERIDYLYGDPLNYMYAAERNGTIVYSSNARWMVREYGALGYLPVWVSHYFTLGVHEFYYLVNHFRPDDHFWGQYQSFVILKFFKLFGFFPAVSVENFYLANPMPGHFQTFWGPAYMDFGSFVLVQAMLCGLIAGTLYVSCCRGDVWGLALYPYILVLMIVGLLANGLVGERLYFVFGLSFVAYMMAKHRHHTNIPDH